MEILMKFLVISDIHGSEGCLKTALASFPDFDMLVLCGDYLNHGPRNPLPEGWNPKGVAEILNPLSGKIACVRGNCDAEVDEMVLSFPCLSPYANIFAGGGRIFVHHGHLYERERLLSWLPEKTVIVSGHTHVALLEEDGGRIFFNPGSISLPKCPEGKTCGTIESDCSGIRRVALHSIEGKLLREIRL